MENKCTKETEIYSRVTGYHRQIKNWNAGKQGEFRDRKFFKIPKHIINNGLHQVIIGEDGKARVFER